MTFDQKSLFAINHLICGDNLNILSTIASDTIDLIYIDPPFFSNRNYEIIWGDEAEVRSFEDRWEGGINVYIDWLKQRAMELYRVLKPTGSMYLHCDWHAGHYLKVMMDEVFGYHQLKNEIVWAYESGGRASHFYPRKHDTLFWYAKSNSYYFDWKQVGIPRNRCQSCQQVLPKWNNLAKHIDKDRRVYRTIKSAGKIYKYYDDEPVPPTDVWLDISHIQQKDPQRWGYPTQKPEALLERIIKSSSNKGELVLDAFCGCGTAMAVAQKLNRRWIGMDISPSAIALVKNRLAKLGVSEGVNMTIIGMPKKIDDLRHFKPFEFQYWIINEMYGSPSPRKVGDMGIDGFSFIEHHPIQVKQSESVGRNVIDNFETALRRHYGTKTKCMKGYIVAFSFGKGSYEEVARAKKDGIEIQLVTVQDILDKKIQSPIEKCRDLF